MAQPLRALVVGASTTAALLHLPILARLCNEGRICLDEICDIQRHRSLDAKAQFGFSRESGDVYAALRRRDIDIVYLFGSAQLHHEYGKAALEHGKHLFVEKPVAPSYAAALTLVEAARTRGLVAVGGLNRRFYRSLGEMRRRNVGCGWRYAEATFHKPAHGQPVPFGARSWLSANGIHALDALVYMMGGLPEQLNAIASGSGATPGLFSAVMRWADGGQGVFLCNNAAGERREYYAFHGIGETYRASDAQLVIEHGSSSETLDMPGVADGFAREHSAFLDAIETGEEPEHSLSAIAPSLFLAQLIEDGFCGPVRLPAAVASSAKQRSTASAVLVINPTRLKHMLTSELMRHPLVTLSDLERSAEPRSDIAAAIVGPGPEAFHEELLAKLPGLSIVGLVGLSFARHVPDALAARNVALVNASAAYAGGVAEYALGLAILARRRAFVSDRAMRRGGWGTVLVPTGPKALLLKAARASRPVATRLGLAPILLRAWHRNAPRPVPAGGSSPFRELRGAIVGLVGWGANARAFSDRLLAAGARVLVYSDHAAPHDIEQAGALCASLDEVLAADIVSLHRGLTAATRHGLGAAELAKLRPGAILINVARGALIEPHALLTRLKQGDIFACLDTFEEEPPRRSHPLRKLPNVFLSSHIAGGSSGMVAAGEAEVIGKIVDHLGGQVIEAVSPDRLATMT
jgi:phosphoglycerate dehydrogenase-like enzyme/predicted dehydrogenase